MRMSLALVSRSSMAMRRGRGKRRRRGDVAHEISWDLMIEILTRLPAKSLMRFKCVSKLWLSLIRSRYFSNRYLTVPRPPRLYVSWLDSVDHLGCDSMEVCHPVDSVLLSLSTTSRATSFDLDLTMPGMGGHGLFILRGLILYVVCTKACIYNPATRQSVTLPAVKSNLVAQKVHEKFVFYFLGHDPVLDQYKVVCTILICPDDFFIPMTSEHWVFLLESGGSWRKIVFGQPHYPKGPQLCIDGVIYYIAAATNTPHDILVSFDVRSEEVSMIQAPLKRLSSKSGRPTGFIEYGGKPTIFDQTHFAPQGLVDLWVLEDGEKWFKTSLALQPCQMHFVNNDDSADFMVDGTTRNGQVILTPTPMVSPSYFLYYDLQKNDLRKIDIRGVRDHGLSKPNADYASYWALMDKGESIMHLET